jgi:hypothetical protein
MLGLDYEIGRSDLMEDLKFRRGFEMLGPMMSVGAQLQSAMNDAANRPAPTRPRAEAQAEQKAMEAEQKKADADKAKFLAERKVPLAALAKALAARRLDLEDTERRYRAAAEQPRTASAPIVSAPADAEVARVESVPILGPIRDADAPFCLNPPTEDEVWKALPKPRSDATRRTNARFTIEKIGEKADDCKVYPLAGPCRLVHCHYKCIATFDEETPGLADVAPRSLSRHSEVVFLDKDHLTRCGDAGHGHDVEPAPAPAEQGVEPRVIRIEEKLDRILKALDVPKPRIEE